MADLDLDAIEQRFGADVRARREHDPAVRDVLALTNEIRRLHSWGGLLSLLDRHWPTDIFPTPEGLDAAKSTTRRDTGPVVLGLIRWVNKLAAEREAYAAQLERYDGQAWDDLQAERDAAVRRAEQAEIEVESLREWSNDLAELMPPEYDGDEAQEDIILHWARDVHDDQSKQHTETLARAEAAEQAVTRVRKLLDILDDFDPGDVSPTSIIADDLRRALVGKGKP